MTVQQNPTFNELYDWTARRGMWTELTAGMAAVRVTDRNRRVLITRPIDRDGLDKAAAGCLAYLTGNTPR